MATTEKPIKLEIRKEIYDLNEEMNQIQNLMNDYRTLATGEFNKEELRQEFEELRRRRNLLLSNL